MKPVLWSAMSIVLAAASGCGPPADLPSSPAAVGGANEVVVDASNFEQVVMNSDQPVLVDFWATWCGPCKLIAPAVAEIAGEYQGRAVVAKLDVDAAPSIASRYQVTSIPTLIVFNAGAEVSRVVGVVDKSVLTGNLDEVLE